MLAKFQVLITDPFPAAGGAVLDAAGTLDIELAPGLAKRDLLRRVGGVHGLIVRGATRVDADVLAAASRLCVIGRAGIGVDNIDVEEATRRKIPVVNAPSGSAVSTAEHTIGMVLALARKIPQGDAMVKAGGWSRAGLTGCELRGKVMGVIGLGRIGSIVAELASAIGMRVVGHDPAAAMGGATRAAVELVDLDTLLARADFVSLHVPLTPATRGLIGERAIAKMKRGARLVNCSRGGIVDEAALAAALADGHLGGVALDVFSREPPPPGHPLLSMDNVVLTPHLGSRTREAQARLAVELAGEIRRFFEGGELRYAVNVPPLSGKLEARRLEA